MTNTTAFQVGSWRIDAHARSITNGIVESTISPRAVRVLDVLARAHGDVVRRSDLLDACWPSVTVSDESLSQVISELRRVFKKGENGEPVIQTIARSGYRITVPVLIETPLDAFEPASEQVFDFEAYRLCLDARMVLSRSGPGSLERAEVIAREAARRAPQFALAQAEHATKLVQKHVYDMEITPGLLEALEKSEAAVRLRPDLAICHAAHGYALGALGRTHHAKRALGQAMTCDHADADVHFMAARTLFSLQDYPGAAALAERAGALDPDGYRALYLASRAASAFDPARAKRLAEQTLQRVRRRLAVDPAEPRAVATLGPLMAQLGEFGAAAKTIEEADIGGSPLEFYRVVVRAIIGDVSGAFEALKDVSQNGWCYPVWLRAEPAISNMNATPGYQRIAALHGVA